MKREAAVKQPDAGLGVSVHPEASTKVAAKRERSADKLRDPLTQYLEELQGLEMMSAAQEIELAQRIEELEIAHWKTLLSYPPALDVVVTALKPHMRLPKEVAALRKLVAAAKGARPKAGWERAVELAARRLRLRDVARVALHDADRGVREALADEPRHQRYLARVAKARAAQQAAKNRFMTANLRLVISLARRYNRSLMPLSDMIQEGNFGLMRAVERFDHRRGFRFSTYAAWWIRHALNRALSDKGRLVRVPVHVLDDMQRAARASAQSLALTGEAPSTSELSDKTGMSAGKLAYIQAHAGAKQPASLDRRLGEDGDTSLLDLMADPDLEEPEEVIDSERWSGEVDQLLGVLTPLEAAILRFRFGLDSGDELTLREIGAKYNLSRERIRQLQEQALQKLRAELRERERPKSEEAAA